MPRLFSALEIPDDVRAQLAALRTPIASARWVAPEDLHLTLRFFGEVSRRQQDEIGRMLADVGALPPEIRIAGTAAFGGKAPHALYAVVAPTPALEALARAHDRAARACGLPAGEKSYVPHVTLARLDGTPVEIVARFFERTGDLRVASWWPQRAVLMSAREGGGGPYGIVDAFPFPGADIEDDA